MPRFSPRNVVAKTTSYTVLAEDGGMLFTTRGAGGAVTFTLPSITGLPTGWSVDFFNVAGQNMAVAATSLLTTFNNATASSVTFSTSSELIGASVRAIFDGTTFLIQVMAEETQTMTVA